jgi:hypothetical protein
MSGIQIFAILVAFPLAEIYFENIADADRTTCYCVYFRNSDTDRAISCGVYFRNSDADSVGFDFLS